MIYEIQSHEIDQLICFLYTCLDSELEISRLERTFGIFMSFNYYKMVCTLFVYWKNDDLEWKAEELSLKK